MSRPSKQAERESAAKKLANTFTGRRASLERYEEYVQRLGLQKLLTRRWKAGDLYAPHDLSSAEMRKWRMAKKPETDAFDALALNPLEHYKVRTVR